LENIEFLNTFNPPNCRKEILIVVIKIVLVLFIWLSSLTPSNAAEDISFKGTSKSSSGDTLTLTGKLLKPQGNGPFPAIILMHGCRGMIPAYHSWAEKISSWGYVTLVLDSFTPRGEKNVCERVHAVPFDVRATDAFDAKAYLAGLSFVNRSKVALIGWSHGGCAALSSVSQANLSKMFDELGGATRGGSPQLSNYLKESGPFQAVIAFYPWCVAGLDDSESPLLILSGEKDTWTPPILCQLKVPLGKTKHEATLKIYPGATHGFDLDEPDVVRSGHKISYDPKATADATKRVKSFLGKYLK
jgi:dienelactone hydrolase